jgi:hypothetical protein
LSIRISRLCTNCPFSLLLDKILFRVLSLVQTILKSRYTTSLAKAEFDVLTAGFGTIQLSL